MSTPEEPTLFETQFDLLVPRVVVDNATGERMTLTVTATPVPPPVVSSLNPATTVSGGADFTLHVLGSNLMQGCVIIFAGQDEPTTWVSDGDVSTIVKPSLFAVGTQPVSVRNPDGQTADEVTFAFTAT